MRNGGDPIHANFTGPCLEGWITATALARYTTPAVGPERQNVQPAALRSLHVGQIG